LGHFVLRSAVSFTHAVATTAAWLTIGWVNTSCLSTPCIWSALHV
jgi:hypothetical protein